MLQHLWVFVVTTVCLLFVIGVLQEIYGRPSRNVRVFLGLWILLGLFAAVVAIIWQFTKYIYGG